MIQEVVIDKESLEYYEYLDQKYREIVSFLGRADGSVNPMKVHLFLSLAVVPFSSWSNSEKESTEKMESPGENIPEEKQNHLKALCLKYGLEQKGGKYVLKKPIPKVELNELREKMKEEGWKYEPKIGFVEANQ